MSLSTKATSSGYVDRDEMAERLRPWALREMHFRPQGRHVDKPLPTTDDMKMLCRGSMVDIWNFVLSHIRSAQTVDKVCGNLKLQNNLHNQQSVHKDKAAEVAKLQQAHSKLFQELTELTSSIQQVDKEINSLTKEILASEQSYGECCNEVSDVNKRVSVLEAHSEQCHHMVQLYEGVVQQLEHKLVGYKGPSSKKVSTDPTYYPIKGISSGVQTHSTGNGGRSTPTGLESACTKHVRETCEIIGSFLHHVCDAEIDESKSTRVDGHKIQVKDKLWTGVEALSVENMADLAFLLGFQLVRTSILITLLIIVNSGQGVISRHVALDTLVSLSRVVQDSALSLRELTGRINLKGDAEELKFKYETTGQLTDRSSPPTLLQSVHQLIEEGQASHIQRFLESEQAENDAWSVRRRLQTIQQELNAKLAACYRSMPGSTELARALLHNQLELAATETSLAFIKSTLNELTNAKEEKQAAHDQLISKHRKIEDFQNLAQRKQMLIQALVKQNSIARERIEKQKHEVMHYVQHKVCSHVGHVRALVSGLQDSVSQEVDRFAALPLDEFQFADMDSSRRIPVKELSINRFVNLKSRPGGPSIDALLNTLDFPPYKAPEELLPTAMKLKTKVLEAELVLQANENYAIEDDENSTDKMSQKLNIIRRDVEQLDRVQLDSVLPTVEHGLVQATGGLSDCIAVRNTVTAWWEQPAQFSVPWVSADDMSMRQWLDQWMLSTTRLRQLQMNR